VRSKSASDAGESSPRPWFAPACCCWRPRELRLEAERAYHRAMPFKSKAQRRKFAQLLVEGKIDPETYEEWNRETGSAKLPERVRPGKKRVAQRKKRAVRKKRPARKKLSRKAARR
jgi:hypothetical protein